MITTMTMTMLDLETLGTSPGCAILSIGAIGFDQNGVVDGGEFYRVIDLQSCFEAGLCAEAATIEWWMQESYEARSSIFNYPEKVSLNQALDDFSIFVPKEGLVIGNGPAFDNSILKSAYKILGKQVPWPYYNDGDYRTLKKMLPKVEVERKGVYHNALSDAKHQVNYLVEAFRLAPPETVAELFKVSRR